MAKKFKLVGPEELEAVEVALKRSRRPRDRQRLKAIRQGILGQSTMEEVAEKTGVSRATIGTWAQRFREGGIAKVLATGFHQRGCKGTLKEEVKAALKKELATGRFKRTKEAAAWLAAEHGIKAKLGTVYSWLGKVGGVLKVPRKTHARKDAAKAEAFKIELAGRLSAP